MIVRTAVPLALTASVLALAPAVQAAPVGSWSSTVPSLTGPAALYGLVAPRPRAAWAVGSEAQGTVPVVLRWDGTAWKRDRVPVGTAPELVDVAAKGEGLAWVVGQSRSAGDARSLRWNGRVWKGVPYPLATPLSVSVDSKGNAWSTGCANGESDCGLLRYRGGAWVREEVGRLEVPVVAARTPRDVWVGGGGSSGLLRFDGKTWKDVAFPSQWGHLILQILPVSATEIWMYTLPADPMFSGPRLMHWKDGVWSEHKPPQPTLSTFVSDPGFLGRIAGDGEGGVWVQTNRTTSYLHFDGTNWTTHPRSLPFAGVPYIYGLAQVGNSRTVWGAGHGGATPVIERFR